MKTITAEELREMHDADENLLVINTLDAEAFHERHIPGSINIPVGDANFVDQVRQAAGRADREVVVYCASSDCNASEKAAEKLEEAGFTSVYDMESRAGDKAGGPPHAVGESANNDWLRYDPREQSPGKGQVPQGYRRGQPQGGEAFPRGGQAEDTEDL